MQMQSIIINVNSMQGLGDNIYQRPYIKALAQQGDVYINTSWPEMYSDIENVYFVRPNTTLRTQKKNYEKSEIQWVEMPRHPDKQINFGYGSSLERTTITATMRRSSGIINPPEMDLPVFDAFLFRESKPIAIVRPITERKEWLNKARNPKNEYLSKAIQELRKTHFIVSIADIDETNEWKIGDIYSDVAYEKGELSMSEMMSLFRQSSVVIGGVGWILPAAIAAKKHAIIIGGGQLGHNHISRLTDSSMDLSRIHYIAPVPGCYCLNMMHDCDKTIHGFEEWLSSTLNTLND